MSTFTEEGDPKIPKKDAAPIPKDKDKDNKPKTPFEEYVASLGDKYVEKCKEMAGKTEFKISIRDSDGNDKERTFRRKHLTQGQLDEIEDLRITAQDLTESEKGSKKQREANTSWYSKIASYVLYDSANSRFMDKEDFKNAVNKDIKPILDGCIMAEMSGVPN
jgi:hypothetical protein